jgi:acyl-CoA thioester hydrolase
MAHQFRLRVYYEDTDAGGIVYYANYLKFAERARTEALIGLGLTQTALREEMGVLFVVRRVAAEFRAPARLEDQLLVTTAVGDIGGARLDMVQEVLRAGRLLVHCEVALAVVGTDGRPRRLPEAVRDRLAALRPGGP